VIVCGVTTEICVDSTVRDAFARDYNVILIKDAVAAFDNDRHKGALQIAEFGFATLCSVDELKQALGTSVKA
jgi:ureidoacrylate peracid hydrolase